MLEELNNYNNDDKIEMSFPAEQKLEKTRRFSHPTYCFWPQAPTALGRQMSGPAAGLFELWSGGQWRSLGNFRSICRGFPPPNVRLRTRSRERNILPSCASLFRVLQSLSVKSLEGTVYRLLYCTLEKSQGTQEGELLVNWVARLRDLGRESAPGSLCVSRARACRGSVFHRGWLIIKVQQKSMELKLSLVVEHCLMCSRSLVPSLLHTHTHTHTHSLIYLEQLGNF